MTKSDDVHATVSVCFVLEWRVDGEVQPNLCKFASLPAVPGVGTHVHFTSSAGEAVFEWGGDPLVVSQVIWWEQYPGRFDVVLRCFDVWDSGDAAGARRALALNGWVSEDARWPRTRCTN